MLNAAVRQNRIAISTQDFKAIDRFDLHNHIHGDVAIHQNSWREVEIHTDIDRCELHNRRPSHSTPKSRLKAALCHGLLSADAELGNLSVGRSQTWVLENAALVRVAKNVAVGIVK